MGHIPPGFTKQSCDCRLVFLLVCDVRKCWPGYTVQISTAQRDTWRSQRFKQCRRLFYSPVSPLVARTQSVFLTLRWSLSVDTGNHDGLLSSTLMSLMSRLNVSPGLRCVTLLTPKQPCYRSLRREIDFGHAVVCACMSVRACTWEKHTGRPAHLMQAVGQGSEALHMGQSQQAAEEAVEGGLVLPLLLELLSQLKQALPPPVQHPQSQPEPTMPPIRAPPAEDKSSSPLVATALKHHR